MFRQWHDEKSDYQEYQQPIINISQIEHTRHRSVWNFYTNVVAGLIAYTYQAKKPTLQLRKDLLLA